MVEPMLKLEKLELRGFKSFCDQTELTFTDTITAVVGPNGCGKSNLSDAITWVLGEQSARLLRGGKMEDVIFQGTSTRQPVGMAEVTLTFVAEKELSSSNGRRADEDSADMTIDGDVTDTVATPLHIRVAPGERITVGRRLYRSGESEYLLNGRRVRLRDIYDLFSGTGLGPGHYAIIGQGHVGEIITAKPFERRAVIESAAGITRFRMRQRAIELKLQSAKQNLTRIDDLMAELDRQINSLKRQAAKARRYRRLKDELRGLLRVLFAAEAGRLESELEAIEHGLAETTRTHTQIKATVGQLEAQYRQVIDSTRQREASLGEVRDRLNTTELQLERTRSQRTSCLEHITGLQSRRVDLQQDEAMLRQQLATLEDELDRCRVELQTLTQAVESGQAELADQESVYKNAMSRVKSVEQQLDQWRNRLLEQTNHHANLRHATRQVELDMERIDRQLSALQSEYQRADVRCGDLEEKYITLSQAVAGDQEAAEQFKQQLDRLERDLKQALDQQAQHAQTVTMLERERLSIEERLLALQELDRRHAYFSPAVQRLFEWGAGNSSVRLLGTLADFVRVSQPHERLVEAALGEYLQTVLVPTLDDALESLTFLQQTHAGPCSFLVVGFQGGEAAPERKQAAAPDGERATPSEHSMGVPLLELLNLEAGLRDVFRQAFPELAASQVVADLETALRFSFDDGRLFLTPEGHRVRAGQFVAGGSPGQDVKSLLGIKRELQQLTARLSELTQAMAEAQQQLVVAHQQVEALQEQVDQHRLQQQAAEKAAWERTLELNALEHDRVRAKQHLRVVEFEITQAQHERTELQENYQRLTEMRQQADAELEHIKVEQERAQAELAALRHEADELLERVSLKRSEVAATLERHRSLQADYERLQRDKQQMTHLLQGNAQQFQSVGEETVHLQVSLAMLEQAIERLESERAALQTGVDQASREVERLHQQADQIQALLDERRADEQQVREQMSHLQVQRAQLVSDARHLRETCLSELAQELDEVIQLVAEGDNPIETKTDIGDMTAVKQRVQQLRVSLEQLGPVNMVALEELQMHQDRWQFMSAQRQDVLASIADTEQALEEIKRRSRRRFLEAFAAINTHFAEVFQELFGGGQGRMVLLDEENPLESGIDIIAQPPGKRLQNINLLSGGEKSMTAIALLLAIFRYRPSPFCLLDEVDAPLDDVNIRRFAKKIQEMSDQTQFIIITHNKITMQSAKSLHGVTMEEPGVSKLVSVRLQ